MSERAYRAIMPSGGYPADGDNDASKQDLGAPGLTFVKVGTRL